MMSGTCAVDAQYALFDKSPVNKLEENWNDVIIWFEPPIYIIYRHGIGTSAGCSVFEALLKPPSWESDPAWTPLKDLHNNSISSGSMGKDASPSAIFYGRYVITRNVRQSRLNHRMHLFYIECSHVNVHIRD